MQLSLLTHCYHTKAHTLALMLLYLTLVSPIIRGQNTPISVKINTHSGARQYNFQNHLSNTLATCGNTVVPQNNSTDDLVDYYKCKILNISDFSPFGVVLKEREYTLKSYRFDFQNQESDPELFSDDAFVFKHRIHNASLGRFLSIDPLSQTYPWNSPYAFAENKVIRFVELEGLEIASPEMFEEARTAINYFRTLITARIIEDKTLFKDITLTMILNELDEHINDPNSTKMNYVGWFCGTSACMNVALNYNPKEYVKMSLELATKGKTQYGRNKGPRLKVPEFLKDFNTSDWDSYASKTEQIYGYTIRNKYNGIIKNSAKLGDELWEGTFPWETDNLLKGMGIKTEHSAWYRKFDLEDLGTIQKAVNEDKLPIIFENHVISHGSPTSNTQEAPFGKTLELAKYGIHFITIHNMSVSGNDITFQYWDYGGVNNSKTMTVEKFLSGMKGYWVPENRKGVNK